MTPAPFFPDSHCPLYAYALPPYHALYYYYVADAPPPAPDCPIALPPVPSPEAPCPTIKAAPIKLRPFGDSDTFAATKVKVTDTGCCEFLVDVGENTPCAPIGPKSQTAFGKPFFGQYSYIRLSINRRPRPLRYAYYPGYPPNGLYYYDGLYAHGDDCDHVFKIDFAERCQLVAAKPPQPVVLPFTSDQTKVGITVTQNKNCDVLLDLFGQDHCPQFKTDIEIDVLDPGATPTGSVSIVGDDDCNFLFTLTLGIPRSCEPSFGFGDLSVTTLAATASPSISGSVTKVGECGFLLNLSLGIPAGGGDDGGGGGPGGDSGSNVCQVRSEDVFFCDPVTGKFMIVPGCFNVVGGVLTFTPDPPADDEEEP